MFSRPCKGASRSLYWLKCRNIFSTMTLLGFWILKDSAAWNTIQKSTLLWLIARQTEELLKTNITVFDLTLIYLESLTVWSNVSEQNFYLESLRDELFWEEKDWITFCHICLDKWFLLGNKDESHHYMLSNKTCSSLRVNTTF